jgi:pimeloyl-ACP methyl ester carboxylesterase
VGRSLLAPHPYAIDEHEPMTTPGMRHMGFVESGSERIAVHRWGADSSSGDPLILVHGTGFLAGVWDAVARDLAKRFRVYAIDRRGHGRSSKPDDAYHFADFADDLCAVIDHLGLDRVYGVGHSAGATDVLLAAAQRPGVFARVFAMEPTIMDPRAPNLAGELGPHYQEFIDAARRRRSSFSSAEEAADRYATRGVFATWPRPLLEGYAADAFEARPDGQVHLRCAPRYEVAMLGPIVEAMDARYVGDARGNPFGRIGEVDCPVRISTTERSADIYDEMARRARAMLCQASAHHFADSGHCVAQERPDDVTAALLRFADASD